MTSGETNIVDPSISDRDLDRLLHRQLSDFEATLLSDVRTRAFPASGQQ
jgi:hypothetical protein